MWRGGSDQHCQGQQTEEGVLEVDVAGSIDEWAGNESVRKRESGSY